MELNNDIFLMSVISFQFRKPENLLKGPSISHRSRGQSRDVQKLQGETEDKSANQELRNEPPHDVAVRLPQNPFLASLWIGSGLGDPEAGQNGILG